MENLSVSQALVYLYEKFFMMFLVFLGMSNEQRLWCISTWCGNMKWKIRAEMSLYLEAFLGKWHKLQWIYNLNFTLQNYQSKGNFGKHFLKNSQFWALICLFFLYWNPKISWKPRFRNLSFNIRFITLKFTTKSRRP